VTIALKRLFPHVSKKGERKMKLNDLEERARQEQEEQQLLAAEEKHEEQLAAAEDAEEFRQEVIAWMVKEGDLDAAELEATLSVVNHKTGTVKLDASEHTEITFRIVAQGEGYLVHNGSFEVERHDNYPYYVHSLGNALLIANEEWWKRIKEGAEQIIWEDEREERRKVREAEAAARGNEYLALIDANPILRPILDILGAFLEEREQFAEDLEMAEEFAAGTEARYQEKLGQAQNEVQRAERERHDLQCELWDAQEEARSAERRSKRGR
jgi:hypothetical protein